MKTKRFITLLLALCFALTAFPADIAKAENTGIGKGDVNADSAIDNLDAAYVLRYDAGLIELTQTELLAGDCNGDGLTDNIDAACILKYDAGLTDDVTNPGAEPIYPIRKIYDVPLIGMLPKYQCGCEGVSAVMLLNYHGINVDCDHFFNNVLDTFPFTYKWQTDTYYGEDMDRYYVGDPTHEFGKGCFAPVIKTAIEKIVPDDYIAVVEQGGTVAELVDKYLKKKGQPIMLWATSGMRDSYDGTVWHITRTNGTFTFPAYMHCLVLVGHDDAKNCYYFNDPLEGEELAVYNSDQSEAVDGKTYAIRNAATGKYLTVLDGKDTNGANVIQNVYKKDNAQLFTAKKHSDGSFSFINKNYGKALDIMNISGKLVNGCNVQQYTYNKSFAQRFVVSANENGFFTISCASSPDIALSVYGNYNGDSGKTATSLGNVYISTASPITSFYQQWELIPVN